MLFSKQLKRRNHSGIVVFADDSPYKTTRIMKKAEIVVFKCVKNNKNEGKQESSCFAMKALIRFGVKSGITITQG